MRTRASVFGHPIHPMLVALPLGALPSSLLLDVLHVTTGDAAWRLGALATTAFGVATMAAAIVPGLVDYRASVPARGPARVKATCHLWLGLALLGLFAASLVLRWATREGGAASAWSALGLNALGNLGLVAQGFLGGELRGRHRLGVEDDAPAG